MIIARAPYRITLGGGGTDLPSFYEKHGGFIFAMCIDKYLSLIINPTVIDRRIRLEYLQSELVDHASKLRHGLAREGLLLHHIETAMEITSIGDLPGRAGIGSSGSYLVALLSALHAYRRMPVSPMEIAEEACDIEINRLKEPVGKQDQYMAALGGLRCLDIAPNGQVKTHTVALAQSALHEFLGNTHLYYTGAQRNASSILSLQNDAALDQTRVDHQTVVDCLKHIKGIGYRIVEALQQENFDDFGKLLDDHWQTKKQMNPEITTTTADRLYHMAKTEFGVLGGKIMGAGGGGFLMLYSPTNHTKLMRYMEEQGCPRLHYGIDVQGAKVVADLRSPSQPDVDHRSEPCARLSPEAPASLEATR
jgi:D-glycero-alpha-D-manno-heptose-7-phosphate kinase